MLAAKNMGPLAGLVVIDLTRVLAGPYCTMTLADLGARVIKVEMPELGDDARRVGPFIESDAGKPLSGYFFSVNRNKESIALDLKSEQDRAIFERLLASADVLVENFSPGTMHRLGYDWDSLHARFPKLVMASISGFGQTGPYRELPAYDMVVQAMGGVLSLTGEEGGPPTRVGVSIGDIGAGMFGAIGVQAAIIERQRTGVGKHVDVAMLDSQVALLENALVRYQVEGKAPGPIGSRHPSITPFGVFKAKVGHLVVAAGNDRIFPRLCEILGMADTKKDSRFTTNALRCENHSALKEIIEQALAKQLLSPADRQAGLVIEFNLEGLLRGDSGARASFYQQMLSNGVMTINEVRALENLPPVEGGDVPRMQMQNVPISQAGLLPPTGAIAPSEPPK